MPKELVEVVDLNDELTGEIVTLEEAHTNRIPHRVSAVHVFAPDGRMYVQVRNEPGFRRDHTAAGHVDLGESYEQAARREMFEEINLDVPITLVADKIHEDFQANPSARAHFFGVYRALAPDDWKFTPNDEVSELILMEIPEIVEDMKRNPDSYTHGFRATLQTYLESERMRL